MAIKRFKDPVLIFSDIDMDFKIDPRTRDVSAITGENTVKQALNNLLRYRKYDKPFHPEVNAEIMDLLFEPASQIIMFQMKRKITETIQSYEPRVREVLVDIIDMTDQNAYKIDVQFRVQNSVQTFYTTVLVERTR